MSILREIKWTLLELFPDQLATEADAEKAAREKVLADARAEVEAQALAEAEAKAKEETAEKDAPEAAPADKEAGKTLSAVDQAAQELASIDLVPKKKDEEARAAAAPVPEPEQLEDEEPAAEDDEPPVSLEHEGTRPPGVLVRDYAARGYHLDVLCATDQVVAAAQILDQKGFTLESISGVDWIKEEEMEVVYDYSRTDGQLCRVAVRARMPRSAPAIPTISEVFPGANWHERETHEFFGIVFEGHPYLVPLLLPEDADFHPLLKDFTP